MNKIFLLILLALFGAGIPCRSEEQQLFVFLGDSNLWIGGDDCSKDCSWSHEVCKSFNARGINLARSGATWTCTSTTREAPEEYSEKLSDNNVIFNQVVRLMNINFEKDYGKWPDAIFVAAGTNDAWFEQHRPGMWNMSPAQAWQLSEVLADAEPSKLTSLPAAVVNALCIIAEGFEDSRIVVVGPPLTTACSEEKVHKVSRTIQQSLGDLAESITFVKLDSPEIIDPTVEKTAPTLTTDGTHTNHRGAKAIADKIIAIMR